MRNVRIGAHSLTDGCYEIRPHWQRPSNRIRIHAYILNPFLPFKPFSRMSGESKPWCDWVSSSGHSGETSLKRDTVSLERQEISTSGEVDTNSLGDKPWMTDGEIASNIKHEEAWTLGKFTSNRPLWDRSCEGSDGPLAREIVYLALVVSVIYSSSLYKY